MKNKQLPYCYRYTRYYFNCLWYSLIFPLGVGKEDKINMRKKMKDVINNIIKEISVELDLIDVKTDIILIAYQLNVKKYSNDLFKAIGREVCKKFYKDSKADFEYHLSEIIAKCIITKSSKYLLDKKKLTQFLIDLEKIILDGKLDYKIKLRLLDISITEPFYLKDTVEQKIYFQTISKRELLYNYPANEFVSQIFLKHWENHLVEVVFEFKGTLKEIENHNNLEEINTLIRSITNSILISKVLNNSEVNITHTKLTSPFHNITTLRGARGGRFYPINLTSEDLFKIKNIYNITQDIKNDNVLIKSIDRFILGLKQGNHHPNKTNSPNWDKIVDYTIACETLFLTINKSQQKNELSYRFRLNGSSLISNINNKEKNVIFRALNELYSIRSKVVHGEEYSKIIGHANKFITILNIDNENQKHDLGRLMLVSNQVETWLLETYQYLNQISLNERPYNKQQGWEELLWS